MKKIHDTIPYSKRFKLPNFITEQCPLEKLLFFDIETTGFVAKNTTLYLIGALYYREKEIHILQWFNDDGKSEKEILDNFFQFTKNFTHLIHYNGSGFDIPYLLQKAQICKLPFLLTQMQQIDIYKEIRPFKKILATENLKQVTIERFLTLTRTDTYSGGELIPIYQSYLQTKSAPEEEKLLLHNHDDLLGMPQLSVILNYSSFFKNPVIEGCKIQFSKETSVLELYFTIPDRQALPKRILFQSNDIFLNIMETEGFISIPVKNDTLFHFFSDYRNYYYLPNEDMAIHKSVATYVEPANRIKATRNNCYVKKNDGFIPCSKEDEALFYLFSNTYNDKQQYIRTTDLLDAPPSLQQQYIIHIIQGLK